MTRDDRSDTGRGDADVALRLARERLRAADYEAARREIERAARSRPGDAEIVELRATIERAAERHAGLLARQQQGEELALEIESLLEADDLDAARRWLDQAERSQGRHEALAGLRRRLEARAARRRDEEARALGLAAAEARERDDLPGALRTAERAVALAPDDPQLIDLVAELRGTLERRQAQLLNQDALSRALDQIEHLLEADEPARAAAELETALERLGSRPELLELAPRIDDAKLGMEARRRADWLQRRRREAELLVEEAARRLAADDADGALKRLETADERLGQDGPEALRERIATQLAAARAARERLRLERARAAERRRDLGEVTDAIEALRLDAAATALAAARRRHGDDPKLVELAARLEALHELERTEARPPLPDNVASLSRAELAAAARREQAFGAGYSVRQAVAYPLRGDGPLLVGGLAAALIAADLLALAAGWLGVLGRCLLWWFAASCAPHIVRQTLAGDEAPRVAALRAAGGGGLGRDLSATLCVLAAASAPVAVLLAAAGVAAGPLGSPSAAVGRLAAPLAAAGWLAVALSLAALVSAGAYGWRSARHLKGHLRALGASSAWLAVVGVGFTILLASVLLRLAVAPTAPAFGLPLAAAIEAWAFVGLPHLAAVVVGRRRLAWTRLYA
ncbi:MAG: hypothetical protein AAGN46_08515 [Acidobacteriota bacterium]